jgi:hypothetical protein
MAKKRSVSGNTGKKVNPVFSIDKEETQSTEKRGYETGETFNESEYIDSDERPPFSPRKPIEGYHDGFMDEPDN